MALIYLGLTLVFSAFFAILGRLLYQLVEVQDDGQTLQRRPSGSDISFGRSIFPELHSRERLGLVVAFARTSNSKVIRYLSTAYIRFFQGTPLLIQLFIAFFLPGFFGLRVNALVAASVGLSFNASAYLGEIWRGCIEAVPKGQWEASTCLGFRRVAQLGLIILLHHHAHPPTVGYLVQLIRDTSLASIIGFIELSRAGYDLANATYPAFFVYSIVAVIYFSICFPLSKASVRLERRLARAHHEQTFCPCLRSAEIDTVSKSATRKWPTDLALECDVPIVAANLSCGVIIEDSVGARLMRS